MRKLYITILFYYLQCVSYSQVRCFGDSFTQGVGANDFESYPTRLHQIINYPTINYGIGGATSTEIKNRLLQDSANRNLPTIIWAGYNNIQSTSTVLADIQAMVNSLGHQRFLILSVMNNCSRPKGTVGYDYTIAVNTQLKALYGYHYLDVRDSMVHYLNDSLSISNDIPNQLLMWDCVHCNAAGYNYVAQLVAAKANVLLSVLSIDTTRVTRRPRAINYNYEVYDMVGRLLQKFSSTTLFKRFDVPKGFYIIRINNYSIKYFKQ